MELTVRVSKVPIEVQQGTEEEFEEPSLWLPKCRCCIATAVWAEAAVAPRNSPKAARVAVEARNRRVFMIISLQNWAQQATKPANGSRMR
jgi:hypothetical protein